MNKSIEINISDKLNLPYELTVAEILTFELYRCCSRNDEAISIIKKIIKINSLSRMSDETIFLDVPSMEILKTYQDILEYKDNIIAVLNIILETNKSDCINIVMSKNVLHNGNSVILDILNFLDFVHLKFV